MAQAQILYVGTANGLAIFSNPGRSHRWLAVGDELPGSRVLALGCAPDQPLSVYAVTEAGTIASSSGGQSWEPASQDHTPTPPQGEIRLQGQPATVLRAGGAGIQRSEDEGQTWQPTEAPVTGAATVLLAATYHPDTAFAGTDGGEVWISTDRGRSWQLLAGDLAPVLALAAGRAL